MILEEAKCFSFEEQQSVNQDENITSNEFEPIDVDTTSQWYWLIYAMSVILEGEFSSTEIQAVVGNHYQKLQFAFNNFRNILKETCQQQNVSAKS